MTDDEIRRAQSPGCFGAMTVYSSDSNVCKSCAGFKECGVECVQTLASLRATIDVDSIIAKHRKLREKFLKRREAESAAPPAEPKPEPPKPMKEPEPMMATAAPAKNDEVGLTISKGKTKKVTLQMLPMPAMVLRAQLLAGVNPFNQGDQLGYMRVACQMLLEGGLTHMSLRQRLASEGLPAAHRQLAIALLRAAGAVEENNGIYVIKR